MIYLRLQLGNANGEATLAQLKDQYNSAKQRYFRKIWR